MLERIAVDLGGRRDDKASLLLHCQAERVVRAERADLQRLNRELEIVDRTCRACPVKNEIDGAVDVDVPSNVVPDEFEIPVTQVRDVGQIAGEQVVDPDDLMTTLEERFAQMRSNESRGAGDDAAHGQERCSRPRKTVSHMIFRSSVTDQFSM